MELQPLRLIPYSKMAIGSNIQRLNPIFRFDLPQFNEAPNLQSGFQLTGDPDQNNSANKRHDNRSRQPESRQSHKPKQKTSDHTADNAEQDIHRHPKAAALHRLSGQPSGN